jgi:hypothetical protein
MRRAYYTGRHQWDEYRIVPRPNDPYAEAWPTWGPFEKCCWYWNAVNEYSVRFMDQLAPGRGLAVSAESLFFDHGKTANRIFRWLNLAAPSPAELAEVLATPENAQQQGNFPKWADWTHEQQSTLRAIAGDTASRLGYRDLLAPALRRAA